MERNEGGLFMPWRVTAAAALVGWMVLAEAARGAEAWADAALPVSDGLLLWLDAGRQGAARKALDLPPVGDGGRLSAWFDGSGNKLHVVQRAQPAQPRLAVRGKHAAVRFDGTRTYLGVTGQDRTLKEFTLFVVAAPRSNAGFFRALLAANETGRNDYT